VQVVEPVEQVTNQAGAGAIARAGEARPVPVRSSHQEVDTRPDPGRRLRQPDQAHHGAVAEADGDGPGDPQGVLIARLVNHEREHANHPTPAGPYPW